LKVKVESGYKVKIRKQLEVITDFKVERVSFELEGSQLIIRPVKPACIICGSEDHRTLFLQGKTICIKCVEDIKASK